MITLYGFPPKIHRTLNLAILLRTPQFITDKGRKDLFRHNECQLTDPLAALLYLEDIYTGTPLFGTNPVMKARYTQLINDLFAGKFEEGRIRTTVENRFGLFIQGSQAPTILDLAFEPYVNDPIYTRDIENYVARVRSIDRS